MNTDAKQVSLALTAPFPAEAVHWKPLAVRGNRALQEPGFEKVETAAFPADSPV